MRVNRRAVLAAGLIAGAAVMTGCTAATTPAATAKPAVQATAQPATAQPAQTAMQATAEPAEETGLLSLSVDGKETGAQAMEEDGMLLLPLIETAEALGYQAVSEQTEEEGGEKRVVSLEKDGSRITVSWTVNDNTVKSISWQKDGLLIPVDTHLTTKEKTVYVPSAFFEEAMQARINKTGNGVSVMPPEPADTPDTEQQDIGENG